MGNKLCAPWKKPYIEDNHWTPRKDSHLLRLWAEIFQVQEANGEICWSRVSDDVVPVNITCIQNNPSTVFHITAYNRHVEKIFDVRLIQPGTRITQASECFAHWKDSKCNHEWGLNFTSPLDASRFYDCCMGSTKQNWRKAASSVSLGLSPPQKVQCRKAASNPTSPVAHSRPSSSVLDEFLVEDAIEAGFVLPEKDKQHNRIAEDVCLDLERRKTCQLSCENIYTRLGGNYSPVSCICHGNNSALTQSEIAYNNQVMTNRLCWVPGTYYPDLTAGTAQHKCNGKEIITRSDSYYDHVPYQELRQFSREPSTINICNMKTQDQISADDINHIHDTQRCLPSNLELPTKNADDSDDADDMFEQRKKCAETLCSQPGFDSNTLKRLLQTFPISAKDFKCPISRTSNTNWACDQQGTPYQESQTTCEQYCHLLPQNNINNMQSNTNLVDMTMKNNGSIVNTPDCVVPLNDEKENENIEEIDILPYQLQQPFTSRSTAIRKAGFLLIQNWLSNKIVTVVQSPHRYWKQFWICLKGTALLLYDFENGNQRLKHPSHVIVVSGCLAHPHSEPEGCEFSVSTIFGYAYLFKTSSKAEMSNWIHNIHLACAASYARHLGKTSAIKLLSNEIHRLENSIDLDLKMKKMAGMQMHTVNDPENREILNRQIVSWDENLEKLFIEQFQLRCYLSALQGSDLPCSKMLLSNISDATKANFDVLSPVAFHAFFCARMPITETDGFSHSLKNHDHRLLSTFKADNCNKLQHKAPRAINLQWRNCSDIVDIEDSSCSSVKVEHTAENILVSINLPKNQTLVVHTNDKTTVEDLLTCACNRCQLNPSTHFVRIKRSDSKLYRIPDKNDLIMLEEGESLEVSAKVLFQAELFRSKKERDFGFSIEAKPSEDSRQDLSVYISDIGRGIIAGSKKGLHVGDELIDLNNLMVSELDMVYIETILEECETVTMTVRSCRIIDQSCEIQREHVDELGCLPAVSTQLWQKNELHGRREDDHQLSSAKHEHDGNSSSTSDSLLVQEEDLDTAEETYRTLSDRQRCREVIVELIETERLYVRDLNCLIESYLEPLKGCIFLSDAVIERLFVNIKEILKFHKIFLQSMEDAVHKEGPPEEYNTNCTQMKKTLFSLGSAFLFYAQNFKLYSSFCASHSKAQKILLSENISFKEFLRLHNLNDRQSASLESYLIKPIRRIVKYTHLLGQLIVLTNPRSEECAHLKEAFRGMEAVAEHINEMQKIYEEYGSILDEMMKDYRETHPQARDLDLNVGELQMYGTVNWLNVQDEFDKVNKGMELLTLLFIFKSGVVLLAQEGKWKSQYGRPLLHGENIEAAHFKIFIPVKHLHVRTMIGEAYECHGVWEMVQCGSEIDNQPEQIFQFASSQEARRDFIRTIQQTILHDRDALSCHHSNHVQETCATDSDHSPTIQKRPESLLIDPLTDSSLRCSDDEQSILFQNKCVFRSSENIKEETELTGGSVQKNNHGQSEHEVALGSQSTLASDRAGAKLIHASHNPTTYSNYSESREPVGSPIWKPRQWSKHPEILKPRCEDEYPDTKDDKELEPTETKQKVAFRIPHTELHNKRTDC